MGSSGLSARENFDAVATEFAGETDDRINTMLQIASSRLSLEVFRDQFELAVALLAAHMMALSDRAEGGAAGGAAGPVIAERAGEVSVNYGQTVGAGVADAYYGVTSYGKQFLELRRSRAGTKPFSTYGYR